MRVRVNKEEAKPDIEFNIEEINSIRFEDVKGQSSYIHIFDRKDDHTFIETYKTLREDVNLCPICGKFNITETCECSGEPVTETEDNLIDIFTECMALPYVDIYINDELVRKSTE